MEQPINQLPAFCGIASVHSKEMVLTPNTCNSVVDKQRIKIYATKNSEGFYKVADNGFLWIGGKSSDTSGIQSFDPVKTDKKFVFVKFKQEVVEVYTDHFSKIPLLYIFEDDTFYFSTSLGLLMELTGKTSLGFSEEGLIFYYHYGFSNYRFSLLKGLRTAPGGYKLCLRASGFLEETYFNIITETSVEPSNRKFKDNVKLIDRYLLDAVKRSLNGFNSIGIALSGGVDSGYLAQKINEAGHNFKAYTLAFKDSYNEFERIDHLSKTLGFSTEKTILNPTQIIENYLEVNAYSSFPVSFNNSILNTIYKKANADNVELMFDGDGADRLFLGMNKYLQLQKILSIYNTFKVMGLAKPIELVFSAFGHKDFKKMAFYFKKFNANFPFYGERKLDGNTSFDLDFEKRLNTIALPNTLQKISKNIDDWSFFTLFSLYYTPTFFFHTPYELQIKHNIVSNPQFWSDDLVKLALQIPVSHKLQQGNTKVVLREAARSKIDDGYWNLSKIGLQNSYHYIQGSKEGSEFINDNIQSIKTTEEYRFLRDSASGNEIDAHRLVPYYLWKTNFKGFKI